jgi:hypothetical protein
MRAIELLGIVDEQHRLTVDVPDWIPVGPVRVLVFVLEAGDQGLATTANLFAEDLYSSEDDAPANPSAG